MRNPVAFIIADSEFYAPLQTAERRGQEFAPSSPPAEWTGIASDIWLQWSRPGLDIVPAGWKVHVSALPQRAQVVLDTVAEICFELDIAFKHVSCGLFFNAMHTKGASRAQAGKFIAAYPTTVDASRELMERLTEALDGEEGPYILTDRRFRDSKVVFYRYGAYHRIERVNPDGTRKALVPDASGHLVEDVRGASFHLPEGITDPFVEPISKPAGKSGGGASIHGFTFEKAIQHSNSGGAYRATEDATGRKVFVKEARAHNSFGMDGRSSMDRLRREWQTLEALHAAAPGLAPEPIAYFREWEHEFMVTEHVEGVNLTRWVSGHNTWIKQGAVQEDFADYSERTEAVTQGIERALNRLHEAGYVFIDVSPNNVLIDDEDRVRLVDFEAASPIGEQFESIHTPGYSPSAGTVVEDPIAYDDYGLSALALTLLFPFQDVAQRRPAAIDLLRRELEERAPVPEIVWTLASKAYHSSEDAAESDVDAHGEQLERLRALRDGAAAALAAMADPENPIRIYPTIAEGYASNTICVNYGTAGVVHALRKSGLEVPEPVMDRLRREAADQADALAPGLFSGLSGLAWVLADSGYTEDAEHLLDLAVKHPLTEENATFAEGSAGVAMACAALYGRTGDSRHLERAVALAASLPADDALTPLLGINDSVGFFQGRTGIALMLQQLGAITGEDQLTRRALRLIHAELDRASNQNSPALAFPVSATDTRMMPYLFAGSAGVVHAGTRLLRVVDDERLADAMPRMLRQIGGKMTAFSGLCQGLAGLAFALAEHGRLAGHAGAANRAIEVADGLVKYGIPHETGIRFLGDQNLRYSAELWGGSAGVVLALSQILEPRHDPFFTLDALASSEQD